MRRAIAVVLLGWTALGVQASASATVYVPGQYRSDGIYIRPHFKASTKIVPEIARFPPLHQPGDSSKAEMKLPMIEVPAVDGKDSLDVEEHLGGPR